MPQEYVILGRGIAGTIYFSGWFRPAPGIIDWDRHESGALRFPTRDAAEAEAVALSLVQPYRTWWVEPLSGAAYVR